MKLQEHSMNVEFDVEDLEANIGLEAWRIEHDRWLRGACLVVDWCSSHFDGKILLVMYQDCGMFCVLEAERSWC